MIFGLCTYLTFSQLKQKWFILRGKLLFRFNSIALKKKTTGHRPTLKKAAPPPLSDSGARTDSLGVGNITMHGCQVVILFSAGTVCFYCPGVTIRTGYWCILQWWEGGGGTTWDVWNASTLAGGRGGGVGDPKALDSSLRSIYTYEIIINVFFLTLRG